MGFQLDDKVDIAGLIGLMIALATAGYQLTGYFKGADLVLFPPEQILIRKAEYAGSGAYVRFAVRVSYANKGQARYSAIVEKETIRFKLGNLAGEQAWQMFETADARGAVLESADKQAAHPQVVEGSSALSHETYFAPRSNLPGSFLGWEDFIQALKAEKEIEFSIHSKIYGRRLPLATSCRVLVTDGLVRALRDKSWAAPACLNSLRSAGDA